MQNCTDVFLIIGVQCNLNISTPCKSKDFKDFFLDTEEEKKWMDMTPFQAHRLHPGKSSNLISPKLIKKKKNLQ